MTRLDGGGAASLVVPRGWVIDPLAVARLRTQLAASPPDVAAVVAPTSPLPPGASYRSHAERQVLAPHDVAYATDEPTPGAVLVRAGISHRIENGNVTVSHGRLLIDPGCHTHDPGTSVMPVANAVPEGRSPFSRRPLVVFLALEPDSGRAVWARNLVDQLLENETEARLATAAVVEGRHLTRPCRPVHETLRALQPDVVITLDDTAETRVSAWCDRRSTAVIRHTGERTLSIELVSWRIGDAAGRLRALIGGAVDAPALAELCSRLCAMPPPIPPDVSVDDTPVAPPSRVRIERVRRSVAVVSGSLDSEGDARLDAFVAEAHALGEVARLIDARQASSAAEYDAVLLTDDVDPRVGVSLAETRAAAGRRTLVDVAMPGAASELVKGCHGATAPTRQIQGLLESEGIATRLLPSLLTRSELNALQRARVTRRDDDPVVLGVRVDTRAREQLRALTRAIEQLLNDQPSVTVEWLGPDDELSTALRRDPRVERGALRPVEQCAHWTMQAWVASAQHAETAGRPAPLIRSSYMGIPTVFDAERRGDVSDEIIGRWSLEDPCSAGAWESRFRAIADDPDVARDGLEFRAELLFGRTASRSIVNRLVGWASLADRHP